MKCLIIGGAGFIGSSVSNLLAAAGRDVVVLGRAHRPLRKLAGSVKYISGDYRNPVLLRELLFETDELIDLAYATVPKTSFDDPIHDVLANLPAGVGLIREAALKKLKKFVFVSSGGTVYGVAQALPLRENHPTNPISPYGITKLTLEKYILMFVPAGLPAVIVRPSNAYGESQRAFGDQGFIATSIQSILLGRAINIFGPTGTVRDYLHVSDVAKGIIAALEYGQPGNIYNIGSETGRTNMEVLETIKPLAEQLKRTIAVNVLPTRMFDVPANILDCTKLKSISSWRPEIDFRAGVTRTWNGLIEHSEKSK